MTLPADLTTGEAGHVEHHEAIHALLNSTFDINNRFSIDSTQIGIFVKTTAASSSRHAATLWQAATAMANAAAANITSDNTLGSALQLRGSELSLGTAKITHEKPAGAAGNDSGASALSIDRQTNSADTSLSSAARGIFITETSTTIVSGNSVVVTGSGDWITVRNSYSEVMDLQSSGRVGFGIGIGATAAARMHLRQEGTDDFLRLDVAGTNKFDILSTGKHRYHDATLFATSATAGANGDVPAQVAGYLIVAVNGTDRKIPLYAT